MFTVIVTLIFPPAENPAFPPVAGSATPPQQPVNAAATTAAIQLRLPWIIELISFMAVNCSNHKFDASKNI
jgi:hypothetical protein